MVGALFDTNILIDYLRGIPEARAFPADDPGLRIPSSV
jgi:predicted nucleic acid-binding protein